MFNHNIQLAGYPFERTDEKGAIDFAGFSHLFDTFPWQEQLRLAEKLEDGCSATISVKAIGEEKDFWISIASYKQSYIFLIGYVYLRSRKRFWGLGSEEIVR